MRIPSPRAFLVYLHDLAMTGAALAVALYLRVGTSAFGFYTDALIIALPALVGISAAVFVLFGLYRGIWRYASVPDLVQLVRAVTVAVLCFVLAMFLLTRLEALPRSLPPILWLVQIVMLGGPRFAYRLFKDRRLSFREEPAGVPRIPVLLLGVGDATELFIRSLDQTGHAAYRVVGILDEKGRRVGHAVRGVPVLGGPDDLARVVESLDRKGDRPQRLIVAKGSNEIAGTLLRSLLDQAEALGLILSRLPSLTEFKSALGEGKGIEVRPIALEDLLGRPQAVLDRGAIEGLVGGRRVVVTGAGGTIGSELVRQIAALKPESLILVDAGEFNLYSVEMEVRERFPALDTRAAIADVRDRDRIVRLFQDHRPALVFHAAALKHVPLVEANPAEGVLTNVIGTRNVADAARAAGCLAMVLISTDKAIRPTSVMGAAKRFAETYCQALDVLPPREGTGTEGGAATRYMTVRFGNVLGSSGSVVPLFTRQLAKGGPLTVTHPDMRRYFMTVREAVELVLQASAHGVTRAEDRGKILVLDMGEPVKIADLARQMIRLAGYRPGVDIQIAYTGLRPGEKLFEEILTAAEAPTHTAADGVFLASPRLIDYALVNRALGELETAARTGDDDRVLTILGNIVPDFRAEAVLPQTGAQA